MKYLRFGLLALIAFLVGSLISPKVSDVASAQPKQLSVPKAWGRVAASEDNFILFEAGDGTIRQYHTVTHNVVMTITRN